MKKLILIFIFQIAFKSCIVQAQEDNLFLANAKNTIEDYYSKLDNIHDLYHPLKDTNLFLAKRIIIDELIVKANGKNLYDNITKATYDENYYSPEEYLDNYITKYTGQYIQHNINYLSLNEETRTRLSNKILALSYQINIIQINGQNTILLRSDTIIHNIIFKRSGRTDLPELPQIQSTQKSHKIRNIVKSEITEIIPDSIIISETLKVMDSTLNTAQIPIMSSTELKSNKNNITAYKIEFLKEDITKLDNGTKAIPINLCSVQNNKSDENNPKELTAIIKSWNNRWDKKKYVRIDPETLNFKNGKRIKVHAKSILMSYDRSLLPKEKLSIDLSQEQELLDYLNNQ